MLAGSPAASRLSAVQDPAAPNREFLTRNCVSCHNQRLRTAGLALDKDGRIYLAGPGGIWVMDQNGGRLGVIATSETPTACTFGDSDGKTLYFTAQGSIYKVRLKVAGLR